MTKLIERRKNNITTYSHLTIKLHTILYTLYQFLHFKQTLNAKSFQYDANTSKREERDGQSERERECGRRTRVSIEWKRETPTVFTTLVEVNKKTEKEEEYNWIERASKQTLKRSTREWEKNGYRLLDKNKTTTTHRLGGTANISSMLQHTRLLARALSLRNERQMNWRSKSYTNTSKLLLHVTSFKVIDTYTCVFISHSSLTDESPFWYFTHCANTHLLHEWVCEHGSLAIKSAQHNTNNILIRERERMLKIPMGNAHTGNNHHIRTPRLNWACMYL